MESIEQWKAIPGYEGYYEVSDFGRVKTLERIRVCKRGGKVLIPERYKAPYPQSDGYLQIGLSKGGIKTSYLLHRLVGMAFIPGDTSLEINHIDFDRKNCRADNLEWETRQGNVAYSHVNGRYNFKEERGITKLSSAQVLEIVELDGKIKRKKVAEMYGITTTHVGTLKRRLCWKHLWAKSPCA